MNYKAVSRIGKHVFRILQTLEIIFRWVPDMNQNFSLFTQNHRWSLFEPCCQHYLHSQITRHFARGFQKKLVAIRSQPSIGCHFTSFHCFAKAKPVSRWSTRFTAVASSSLTTCRFREKSTRKNSGHWKLETGRSKAILVHSIWRH